jgi:hypothetical protein
MKSHLFHSKISIPFALIRWIDAGVKSHNGQSYAARVGCMRWRGQQASQRRFHVVTQCLSLLQRRQWKRSYQQGTVVYRISAKGTLLQIKFVSLFLTIRYCDLGSTERFGRMSCLLSHKSTVVLKLLLRRAELEKQEGLLP